MNWFAFLLLINTLASLILFVIWKNDSYLNQTIKILEGILMMANLLGTLFAFGVVIKIT
jgi:hypothetical protein